jgi:hypothetical protein
MVLTKKIKKYLRSTFQNKGLPPEIVEHILSYDVMYKDLLPDYIYSQHTTVTYCPEDNSWVGINEWNVEDDIHAQSVTFYTVMHGPRPQCMHGEEYAISIGGKNHLWIHVKPLLPCIISADD